MRIRARLNRVSQPLKQHQQAIRDAFIQEVVKVINRIVADGLYTVDELLTMPHDEFRKVITNYHPAMISTADGKQ